MGEIVYPRCVIITKDEEPEPIDVCDNCGREWKRSMLEEVKDYLQRVEPGGVVPSGQCPEPKCGALCYPKKKVEEAWLTEVKAWMGKSVWVYREEDKKFLEMLKKDLTEGFGENCRVWQNESHVNGGKYPQYLCSCDPHGIGGDVCQLWRDGQSYWPMSGDYSFDVMEKCELFLRKSMVAFLKKVGRLA